MDVSGRTENDPAAEKLARNILEYVSDWKPTPRRKALYAGEETGRKHLMMDSYEGGPLSADQILIVGPGGGAKLAENKAAVERFLKARGYLLAIGLDDREANSFLPFKVTTKQAEHIAARFEPFAAGSLLSGVSPADVHNRDPRELPLITGGAARFCDGGLGEAGKIDVVFCPMTARPGEPVRALDLKRASRRASGLV